MTDSSDPAAPEKDPMRLTITHTTRYSFDEPVTYGLQQLRKTPKSFRGQNVTWWQTEVEGGKKELQFEDFNRNVVELISFEPGARMMVIRSVGEVAMTNTHGIVGPHAGFSPLWLYERPTALTKPGPLARALVRDLEDGEPLTQLHALSAAIHGAVSYQVGASAPDWTSEQALEAGTGVCQDHTHIFVTCARLLGHPARYVSGYLMMDDREEQDATHAWAEAHVEGLGWVGFDVSNGISPDTRYVRVATGLDYAQAAPVTGSRLGGQGENLSVSVEVAQQ